MTAPCPQVTREHFIEIYGGGNYKRGLQWLREENKYVAPAREGLGWTAEAKPGEWERKA